MGKSLSGSNQNKNHIKITPERIYNLKHTDRLASFCFFLSGEKLKKSFTWVYYPKHRMQEKFICQPENKKKNEK